MIKFIVKFKIKEGAEQEYLESLKRCILATREEPGCVEYTAFWDGDKNVLTLFECFADKAAAELHRTYPHFTNDFRALKKYYDGSAEVQKYEDPII